MKGQELKIIFNRNEAYLTESKSMSLEQLGLNKIGKDFKQFAFWTIKVLRFDEENKEMRCEVTSYGIGKTKFENYQKLLSDKLNDLQTISFKNIDTDGLLKTMEDYNYSSKQTKQNSEVLEKKSNRQTINETFFIPIKNLNFKLGGVSFHKNFDYHKKDLEITITNYDIREEFDAVKNYFANALNTKKIEVTIKIELIDNNVTSVEAKSPEISKIDKQLIDNVKFEFVKAILKKKIKVEIDKSLFTMDEYFETFLDEKFRSNPFYKNDKELFDDLLKISDTKHYKHLTFLSSKHAHDIMKLRFVHKPFSFIFLLTGSTNYHIVWETLDTEEATWVWHIMKDINSLKMTLRKIEEIINVIKVQGKTAYIGSTEDPFRRIYHDYSEFIDGFVKWKSELENILT